MVKLQVPRATSCCCDSKGLVGMITMFVESKAKARWQERSYSDLHRVKRAEVRRGISNRQEEDCVSV
jgi:hypothetical protein